MAGLGEHRLGGRLLHHLVTVYHQDIVGDLPELPPGHG